MDDVEAVLIEKDIVGDFISMKRVGRIITRATHTVTTFVTPNPDLEVHQDHGEQKPGKGTRQQTETEEIKDANE